MDKSKKFFLNWKVAFSFLGIAVLILGASLAFIFSKDNNEKKLNKSLEALGKEFYSSVFYEQLEASYTNKDDIISFLKKYEETGIKADLDNISRVVNDNSKTEITQMNNNGQECDKKESKVIIYPKAPYGKDDYTMDVVLSCGFE